MTDAAARPPVPAQPAGTRSDGPPVDGAARPFRVVVVGDGMVGSRFAADLLATAGPDTEHRSRPLRVTVLGDEGYEPYNRVLLSEVVAGRADIGALTLPSTGDARAEVHRGAPAIAIDRGSRTVLTSDGAFPYDAVVLATGSAARVPDVPGLGSGPGGALPAGVHALRTLDDAALLTAEARAADAVVNAADSDHLGAVEALLAGLAASRTLAGLGITVRTGARTREVVVSGIVGRGGMRGSRPIR